MNANDLSTTNNVYDALQSWAVGSLAPFNSTIQGLIQQRFSHWEHCTSFAKCVPTRDVKLMSRERMLCTLWGEKNMMKCLTSFFSGSRFLPVAILSEGSAICIDTLSRTAGMPIGAFPIIECSTPDGCDFQDELFIPFPFQYHQYLTYLHFAPEFDGYLSGYGNGEPSLGEIRMNES